MRRADPWEEVERRPDVEVRTTLLPAEFGGAVLERRPGRAWIVLDARLSPVEQRCLLAHELVHLDHGSWRCAAAPDTWDVMVLREEDRVQREVADWLVDHEKLWNLVADMVMSGEDVTRRVIAEEFWVTKPIAGIALDRLAASGLKVA